MYDAAGRLVKEGNKSYTYAWLDKLVSVTEAGKVSANFDYHPDGQIASVTYADGRRENYLWDGLALIHRNGTDILNEPAITGGNPVLSGDKVLFNDLLGNTLGVKDQSSYQPIRMTAFGESDNADAFFTGKPLVGELGYTFLFRNYRPEQGKWQTSDPLGYPDGWNNLAYVNNGVTTAIDWLGGWKFVIEGQSSTTGSVSAGQTVKHPTDGTTIYINYLSMNASQRASGDGSSTLTIACTISGSYRDTLQGIYGSASLSYSITYTVDDKGNVSVKVNGKTEASGDGITIKGSGGGSDTLTGLVNFKYEKDNLNLNQSGAVSVAGINFKVVE